MVYIGCILDLVVVYLHVIPFSCLEDGLETVLDHVTFILPFCLYLMILRYFEYPQETLFQGDLL